MISNNLNQSVILQNIPIWADKVLEVGCGVGNLGKSLKARGVKEVVGIEIKPSFAEKAQNFLNQVIIGDVESISIPFEKGYFDVLIIVDILEHLYNPQEVLRKCINCLSDEGVILLSITNVGYYEVINNLIEGRWKYEDRGILKNDHLRFFTYKEIKKILESNDFNYINDGNIEMDVQYYQLKPPYHAGINIGRMRLNNMSEQDVKDLFIGRYLLSACKTNFSLFPEMINELASYSGLSLEEINARIKNINLHHTQEWKEICGDTPSTEKIIEFYKTTDGYFFDLLKYNYDSTKYFQWMREIRKFCQKLAAERGSLSLMDFGGGIGSQLINLSGVKEISLHYADIPGKTFDYAKWRFRNRGLNIKMFDVTQDDALRDSYFDLILMLDVVEHLPDPEKIIKHLVEHLNPNGYLIMIASFGCDDIPGHINENQYTNTKIYSFLETLGMEKLNDYLPTYFRKK